MRVKVTDQGVTVPRHMLEGIDEVDIRKEDGRVVIEPVSASDPILGLGQNPVSTGVEDASEHHDQYLYGTDGE